MVSGMIERLAIFGATGDLTGRYLLPGLAALRAGGYLGREIVLRGEVSIEAAVGEPGALHDVDDADAVVSAFAEEPGCRV